MLNATMHATRLANVTPQHLAAYNALSLTVPKSLATIATSLGLTVDAAEKILSSLIDESLASRTVGVRDSALYLAL
jgi:hypothetical protein